MGRTLLSGTLTSPCQRQRAHSWGIRQVRGRTRAPQSTTTQHSSASLPVLLVVSHVCDSVSGVSGVSPVVLSPGAVSGSPSFTKNMSSGSSALCSMGLDSSVVEPIPGIHAHSSIELHFCL